MTLTAQTIEGIKVFAPDLMEKRQEFVCRFCNQPMIFVDAQLKIKHFRHKAEMSCDSEPETEAHEHYKWLVFKKLKDMKIGEVLLEHSIGKVRADIYLNRGSWRNIAFEIQATNYNFSKYEEKIRAYAFHKLLVVYIFVGEDFCAEVKPNIYSLKEIEKRIFNQKSYGDTVIGCYLEDEIVIIPSFKEKYAKGRSGHCTDRFIMHFRETKRMSLADFLDNALEYYIKEPFLPHCDHNETIYQKAEGKIPRYKKVCAECAKFIKWLPNKEAEAVGLRL